MFSDYLEALYRNRRIVFDEYRDYVDIPYVSFGFGYWDRYYRDRPWYDSWDHWGDRRDRRWRDRNRDHDDDGWTGDRDRNRDANRSDDRDENNDRNRVRCAPDDPSCDEGNGNRRGRRVQQMDQMDQMDNQMDQQP